MFIDYYAKLKWTIFSRLQTRKIENHIYAISPSEVWIFNKLYITLFAALTVLVDSPCWCKPVRLISLSTLALSSISILKNFLSFPSKISVWVAYKYVHIHIYIYAKTHKKYSWEALFDMNLLLDFRLVHAFLYVFVRS